MSPPPPRDTGRRATLARRLPLAGAVLLGLSLIGSGWRLAIVVLLALALAAVARPALPPGPAAAVAATVGVVGLGGGIIAHAPLAVVGGALVLAGALGARGVNRGRPRARAWTWRAITALGALAVALFVIYPTLLTVGYLAKPRGRIREAALALPHRTVRFPAADGVELAGWWIPGRGRAAVIVVHGGGGDRQGAVRHATLLARHGYGVLLYDARGRGESGGHENAFGWTWDRDVRGAVDEARRLGARRIGLLGISTGAEAVVTEAAGDRRVRAVVADGLQGRTRADAATLPTGDRLQIEPAFALTGWEIRAVRGERPPPPLRGLVRTVAATRRLLLIGTVSFERHFQQAAARGSRARLWALPDSAHTHGLADRPRAYAARVLGLFDAALGRPTSAAARGGGP